MDFNCDHACKDKKAMQKRIIFFIPKFKAPEINQQLDFSTGKIKVVHNE
jgi:hypothetical protein